MNVSGAGIPKYTSIKQVFPVGYSFRAELKSKRRILTKLSVN